ncbi:MAG: hypothetical protein WA949_07375 [Phormidesmis sp.]
MAKLASIDFKVGDVRYRLKGAKWFYNDRGVRGKIGAELTSEGDLRFNDVEDNKVSYQRKLIPLVAALKGNTIIVGNAAQRATSKYIRFWCHPDKVRTAMKSLPGTTVDRSLLPGSYKIVKVFPPVNSNLR